MRYYTLHEQSNLAKNKLQQAVLDLLNGYDQSLVGNVESFKAGVIEKIQELNARHCRCTPLEPYWYQPLWSRDSEGVPFLLHGLGSLTTFSLNPVMKELNEECLLEDRQKTCSHSWVNKIMADHTAKRICEKCHLVSP